jgi:hypothetical protein
MSIPLLHKAVSRYLCFAPSLSHLATLAATGSLGLLAGG